MRKSREAHQDTLFHLVPRNIDTLTLLVYPTNEKYVSRARLRDFDGDGLEVGFHVTSFCCGPVIARLGRNTDIILPGPQISSVHVAFEVHPESKVTILSVRTLRPAAVKYCEMNLGEQQWEDPETVEKDKVIFFGRSYRLFIGPYDFEVIWRTEESVESLWTRATQGYTWSIEGAKKLPSYLRPTEPNELELQSWRCTRFRTDGQIGVEDIEAMPGVTPKEIGRGLSGVVYKVLNTRGNYIAVKIFGQKDRKDARAAVHKELKIVQGLKHVCL